MYQITSVNTFYNTKGQFYRFLINYFKLNNCAPGLEQVHDAVEQSLLKEVAILRECQDKFRSMLEKVSFPSFYSKLCIQFKDL